VLEGANSQPILQRGCDFYAVLGDVLDGKSLFKLPFYFEADEEKPK